MYEFFGFVLFQVLVVWGFQGLIVWSVAVFGEYSRGCSLSLSPIGAGMTGPLSGPVSDHESVRRIRLCVGVWGTSCFGAFPGWYVPGLVGGNRREMVCLILHALMIDR